MNRPNRAIPTQKYKFSDSWKKLINYCKPYLPAIIIALVCAISGTIFNIISPDKIGDLSEAIQKGLPSLQDGVVVLGEIDLSSVTKIATILIVFYLLCALLSYLQGYIMSVVTQRVSNSLRKDISKKINKLPLKYFDSTNHGDILSRVTNDVDTIAQTLNQSIASLVSAFTMFVGSIIMMFITNGIMALVAIGASLIGFMLMMVIMSKSQKYFIKQQTLVGDINAHIEEVYSGHNVVKAYNAEKTFGDKFNRINNDLYKTAWKAQTMSGLMQPLMGFIGNFGFVAVCIVGGLLTLNRHIGFEIIIEFMIYVNLFTQPLSTFAQSMSSLQQTSAASYRVFEFLEEKEISDESKKKSYIKNAKGNIEFKNVQFGYNSDKNIIHDFSANVKAGQKVAIVGPTGAGKTTMVNLLMRFYELKSPRLIINNDITEHHIFDGGKSIILKVTEDNQLFVNGENVNVVLSDEIARGLPKNVDIKFDQDFNMNVDDKPIDYKIKVLTDKTIEKEFSCEFGVAYFGDIFIDNVPVKSTTRENVHDQFCMVLQDTWLFEGTIRENIVYSNKNITDEQVISACKAVGVHHFIETLPNGYDTILNEDAGLSAGQKQLITIARAMIDNAPMLILDEATSSVDTRTEILIQNAMDKLMEGRTSIVIAHRLSTIKNSDLILVMKDGDIIESGNHEQLLSQNGFYADLYNSQFEKV